MQQPLQGNQSTRLRLNVRVYGILELVSPKYRLSKVIDAFILSLIALNAAALVVETVDGIYQLAPWAFQAFEIVSVAVFSAEYGLRIWVCTNNPRYRNPIVGRIRFAISPMMLIDLLAILPFYALLFVHIPGIDLRILRVVRLLARMARMGRYSIGLQTLARVLSAKRSELSTVIVVIGVLLLMTSSLVFFAEHEAQPDNFPDIPHAMWWSVITLTTIGYGDVVPETALGRALGGVTAILGIGLFALPAGILGSGFVDELRNRGRSRRTCPHCGEDIDE